MADAARRCAGTASAPSSTCAAIGRIAARTCWAAQAAAELGLDHIDAPLESRGAPHKDRVLRLAGIFARMNEPALMHCKSGADRTGLAAGIWLLARAGRWNRRWRSSRSATVMWRRRSTGILDAFFRLYGRFPGAHGPKPFLDWVRDDYSEDALRASFQSTPWADRLVDGVLRRE